MPARPGPRPPGALFPVTASRFCFWVGLLGWRLGGHRSSADPMAVCTPALVLHACLASRESAHQGPRGSVRTLDDDGFPRGASGTRDKGGPSGRCLTQEGGFAKVYFEKVLSPCGLTFNSGSVTLEEASDGHQVPCQTASFSLHFQAPLIRLHAQDLLLCLFSLASAGFVS